VRTTASHPSAPKSLAACAPQRGKDILLGLCLVLVTLAVYFPSLKGTMIFDDEVMLNSYVSSPQGLYYIWFSQRLADYVPLTSTSLWIDWHTWHDLAGFHLTNILLHAISAVILWRLLKLMRIPGSWLAALVFAVHPVNVQSVAWISERKNTLAMVFYLVTIVFYLKSKTESRSRTYYTLSVISFALALLSKSAVVPLPFVLILCDWWQSKQSASQNNPAPRFNLLRVTPFFALSLAFGLMAIWIQSHHAIGKEVVQSDSFLARLLGANRAVWFYLYKDLVPLNLIFVYPKWAISPTTVAAWLPLVGAVILAIVQLRTRHAWCRAALFAFAYFILLLLPVLGFISIYFHKFSLVADYWQYFAIIAPIVAVVAGLFTLVQNPRTRFCIGATLAGTLAILTWNQSHIYQSAGAVWFDTLRKNPDCWIARNNYGTALLEAAQTNPPNRKELLETSINQFRESLRLFPHNIEAQINIGSALVSLGKPEEAKAEFIAAQKVDANDAMGFFNLGLLLQQQGHPAEAEGQYRAATNLWPTYIAAYSGLGQVSEVQGKFADAEAAYSKVVQFNPVNASAHKSLARVCAARGEFARAETEYRETIYYDPTEAGAHYHLGNVLVKQHKADEAAEHFRAAIKIHPNYAEAHYQLATYLEQHKQIAEALEHYRAAVQLKPTWLEALNNTAWILATATDDKLRNGAEAITLAERGVMLTQTNAPSQLDTLGAAFAESGRFDEASNTAARALHLSEVGKDTVMQSEIRRHLENYAEHRPCRE
jgi:tetratricopeptide (TPR) repeat protein